MVFLEKSTSFLDKGGTRKTGSDQYAAVFQFFGTYWSKLKGPRTFGIPLFLMRLHQCVRAIKFNKAIIDGK